MTPNASIAPAPSIAIKAMPTETRRTRDVPMRWKLADNSDQTAFRPLFSDRREGWNAARGARNARRQRADTRKDAALMLQAINGPTAKNKGVASAGPRTIASAKVA